VEPHGSDSTPHVPPPSLWPIGFAIGIVLVLVGLVIGSWATVAVGAVLTVAFGFVWLRDLATGHDAALPAEEEPAPAPAVASRTPRPAPEEVEEYDRYPRNVFLSLSTLGIGAAIGGLVTLPVIVMAVGDPFVATSEEDVDLGPIDQFTEGEYVVATYLSNPEQGEVSRRTAYVRNNGLTEDGVPSFTILSNRCVHLGCPVQANGLLVEDEKTTQRGEGETIAVELTPTQATAGFGCPCHGGQYDTEGDRTAGPPVRALDRYEFRIEDGRLVLTTTYSVARVEGEGAEAKIYKYDAAAPGIHVDGIESPLYPVVPPK
jgi:quinol---cytochrome c reductase iron-sulfur subunit, bacillus type